MEDFKVGDRVECIKQYGSRIKVGELGKIVRIPNGSIGVNWDNPIGTHDCDGSGERKHGYNVRCYNIKKKKKKQEVYQIY